MVAQHPRRRRADGVVERDRPADDLPLGRRRPPRQERVEVEREVEASGLDVLDESLQRVEVRLRHEDAGAELGVGVLVGDRPPAPLEGGQVGVVPGGGTRVRVEGAAPGLRVDADVGQRHVLGHRDRHVDAEAVDAAVEPEPQDRVELRPDALVAPVPVRLRHVEQVQVPLPGRPVGVGDARPGVAAEHRGPVVGRLVAVRPLAVAEDEQVALGRAGFGGEGGLEPRMLPGAVVRHEVDEHAQAELVGARDELVGLGERAEVGGDVAVVGDVVAAVQQRRRVPRADPDGVHAEGREVRQPVDHPADVARPVAVRVGERARVDLVDHRAAPPVGVGEPRAPLGGGRGDRVSCGGRRRRSRITCRHRAPPFLAVPPPSSRTPVASPRGCHGQ